MKGKDKMAKADLIAILAMIKEVAKANNEDKTVKFIEATLEEVRKK